MKCGSKPITSFFLLISNILFVKENGLAFLDLRFGSKRPAADEEAEAEKSGDR